MLKKILVVALSGALAACGGGADNKAPIFTSNTSFSTQEDLSINGQLSATDEDGDSINFTVQSPAQNGIFQLNSDGSFVYKPLGDYFGDDTVTVTASDGFNTVNQVLAFVVEGVNDTPVLSSQSVTVTSSATSEGQLVVTDADGDDITFAMVSQPQSGVVTINPTTGDFSFIANELEAISGSFQISFTDGVIETAIISEIQLTPSYLTNLDKANYYYASSQSHLKQAELVKSQVLDDVLLDGINTQLATAYQAAGFSDKATTLFDEITLLEEKASAYKSGASVLFQMGDTERALEYLGLALTNFNQYIATKGIENINSNDVPFLLGLVNDYAEMGASLEAGNLIASLQAYADTVREEEYSTVYGRFLTAFWFYAEDVSLAYFDNKTEANYLKAVDAAKNFAELTKKTGYQIHTRGDYAGQKANKLKALYVSNAAEILFNIGAIEEAKDLTNFALALYGIGNYDPNYSYEADENSEATLATYDYPVAAIAGLVTGLYPDAETNAAFDLLTSSFDISNAKQAMFSKSIVNAIESGVDAEIAVAEAHSYFEAENDLRSYYQSLVEYSEAAPRSGMLLWLRNDAATAEATLNIASDLLMSEAYVSSESSTSYLTGYKGCARLTEIMIQLDLDGHAQAKKCETMINTYFQEEAGLFSTTKAIVAYSDLLGTLNMVGDKEAIKANYPKLQAEIDKVAADDSIAAVEDELEMATRLMQYGLHQEAKTILVSALDKAKVLATEDDSGDTTETVISSLSSWILNTELAKTGFLATPSFITAMRQQAPSIDSFATFYSDVLTRLTTDVTFYTNQVLALSDNQIADNIEALILINFAVDNSEQLNMVINLDINTDADTQALQALYAELLASKDSFNNTSVASVDTDNDGLPNFFNPAATDEEIAASGLVLDTDADNDGIVDSEDPSPLNSNQ